MKQANIERSRLDLGMKRVSSESPVKLPEILGRMEQTDQLKIDKELGKHLKSKISMIQLPNTLKSLEDPPHKKFGQERNSEAQRFDSIASLY